MGPDEEHMLERVSILLNSVSWNCGELPLILLTMYWLASPVGITESCQINLNLQGQQFTQLYCLQKRHHTLYRQLAETL